MTERRIVPVLLPLMLERPYSYAVPAGMCVAAGDLVRVSLGSRRVIGCVWDGAPDDVPTSKLKSIEGVAMPQAVDAQLRRFVEWVAHWTLASIGMVLRLVMRSEDILNEGAARRGFRASGGEMSALKLTPARKRVLDLLREGNLTAGPARIRAEIMSEAGVSASVIDGLVDCGALEAVELPPLPACGRADPACNPATLNDGQADAAALLSKAVTDRAFSVTLLQGVTGSGKTEVYFEAIATALREGRQALVLVPEIALTAQFLDRFAARFGARPAEWHSELSDSRRPRIWQGVASGEVQVVVGARSGLFLPFRDLGLIVIDEEHDPAFKQEDRVHYHARDMAVVRGHISGFPVVLASATPSVESWANAMSGRYRLVELPMRFGARELPSITAIDLRTDIPPKGRWLSSTLVRAVGETLERGEQSLLFLNRRGYAPLTLCRACGHRFRCPSCAAWLVDHRHRAVLQCHHCGHEERMPPACPECGAPDKLVGVGPGVERVAEEVQELFPSARTVILSSDLAGGLTRLKAEIAAIEQGEVDIIVGTQLVAKGHNFPGLTLVGIVDGDIGLASGDPRAAERTFQMLHQVVGRAGRGDAPGRALVQTHAPQHPAMAAIIAGDAHAFYAREADERRLAGLPPFGRLASVLISGEDGARTKGFARQFARMAPLNAEISVLGPAEAPLAMLRGRFRFRLLVKAARSGDMQGFLRHWLVQAGQIPGGIRVDVDVDPMSFM